MRGRYPTDVIYPLHSHALSVLQYVVIDTSCAVDSMQSSRTGLTSTAPTPISVCPSMFFLVKLTPRSSTTLVFGLQNTARMRVIYTSQVLHAHVCSTYIYPFKMSPPAKGELLSVMLGNLSTEYGVMPGPFRQCRLAG